MEEIFRNIKKRANPKDVFYTPIELVRIHLELLKSLVKEDDIIFDPFYGTGAYYNLFPEYFKQNTFEFTEIELDKDFFTFDKKVNVIVSNPPYSCIDAVLKKSVELNPHTISYLIGFHNLTTKRIEYMNKYGYNLINIHLTKVYNWFGMSIIVIFSKNGKNCISFDRLIHHSKT
jgi:type I restriction-modification system DNA methylase subunit